MYCPARSKVGNCAGRCEVADEEAVASKVFLYFEISRSVQRHESWSGAHGRSRTAEPRSYQERALPTELRGRVNRVFSALYPCLIPKSPGRIVSSSARRWVGSEGFEPP